MVLIKFRNGRNWFYANWVFNFLREDVKSAFPGETEVHEALDTARDIGGVTLDDLDKSLRQRIMYCLYKAALDVSEGKFDRSSTYAQVKCDQYKETLADLKQIIESQSEFQSPEP